MMENMRPSPEADLGCTTSEFAESVEMRKKEKQRQIMSSRRTSVSAESITPFRKNYEKIVTPKTKEQKIHIHKCVKNNFLFRNLSEEQYKEVVNSMIQVFVKKGTQIIKQNDVGDYFYAIQSGAFDVTISKDGGPPVNFGSYKGEGTFGELALMYNAPRQATITATEDSITWALDRVTFRRILLESANRKRDMYKDFLQEVPLLSFLDTSERHKIADALESVTYNEGDVVIRQGDIGENFYIIESGSVKVLVKDESGVEREVSVLNKGDYFGELALLNYKPRAATIVAKTRLKCVTMGKQAFQRLFGPVIDIIKRNANNYPNISNSKDNSPSKSGIEKDIEEAINAAS